MVKTLPLLLFLPLVAAGVGAETFRCRDAQGNLVFTDNPSLYRSECEPVKMEDLPPITIVPGYQPTQEQSGSAVSPENDFPERPAFRNFSIYRSNAVSLVEKFKNARGGSLHSALVRKKVAARRALGEIRGQKRQFLNQIDRSRLSNEDKGKIREILTEITEKE